MSTPSTRAQAALAARVTTLLAALVTISLSGSRAEACSCAPPPPPADALAYSTAVFEGYVLDFSTDQQHLRTSVRFQVLRAWKGVHADSVVVVETASEGSACGIEVQSHTDMLVYATTVDGHLSMALCSRTHASADDAGDFVALGTPVEVGTAAAGTLADAGTGAEANGTDAGMTTTGSGCSIAGGRIDADKALMLAASVVLAPFAIHGRRRARKIQRVRAIAPRKT
jgi:hypothetical protein